MAGRNVEGILLFPAGVGGDFDAFLRSLDRPVVTIANRVSDAWPFVGLSDRPVIQEVTHAIIAKGYTRLFFVGPLGVAPGLINLYEVEERYAGFQAAIADHPGVTGQLIGGSNYVEEMRAVDLSHARTAIVCSRDIFALEILNDLKKRGISVPAGVGLMGFDSIDALRYIEPRLSTVEYPIQRMGELAFQLLTDRREAGGAVPVVEMEPRILWGDSL